MSNLITLKTIRENSNKDEKLIVCQTLSKIINDIINNPSDNQKRRIKLDSVDVASNLMPYSGGLESLFEIGFKEDDEDLVLPVSIKNEALAKVVEELDSILNGPKIVNTSNSQKQAETQPKISSKNSDETVAQSCKTTLPIRPSENQQHLSYKKRSVNVNNNKFALKLQNTFDHVLFYENPSIKQKALNLIPVDRLKKDALLKYNAYRKETLTKEAKPYDINDFILLELLAWFKNEFFRWTNKPNCDYCSSNEHMNHKHNGTPNQNEVVWMAGNVEVYECANCKVLTRFPRYNHPEKLLETRNGRCGEWANCFSLCLRSLDFDARYVLDWTDHVWCEVYSNSQKRWLHADPCENTLDKPLVYEVGWNKKLSYIIAFSSYECIDVTWRYTASFQEVMQRRNECDEIWLVNYTNQLSRIRQANLDKSIRDKIEMRRVTEIVEFLTPKKIKDGEDLGRQSGSLQWRLGRGEIQMSQISNNFKFKLEKQDVDDGLFQIQYNTVENEYYFPQRNKNPNNQLTTKIKDWNSATYSYKNIQYKLENDWRMCYLARTEGSDNAFIEWVFDLSLIKSIQTSKSLSKVDINLETKCYENGQIDIELYWSSKLDEFNETDKVSLSSENFENLKLIKIEKQNKNFILTNLRDLDLNCLKIVVLMKNGTGSCAWQHTQLFRQSLNDKNQYLFDVTFQFD